MEEIIGYKDISLGEMNRVIKGYVERYQYAYNYSSSFSDKFSALMAEMVGRISEWHSKTILMDSDQYGVHKMRMKVGLGECGIRQIPYSDTAYEGYDYVFDIEVVYDGEYRDSTYDVTESVCDVFHVNLEVIV